MSGKSKIEWTERTWNPTGGCTIVSPGCTNCYAMRTAARGHLRDHPKYAGTTRVVNGNPVWTGKIGIGDDKAFAEPLRVRKPTMWFVNSMSDLFHESIPDAVIDRVFAVMALCPQHTFQVLTKRADRMRAYLQAFDEYSVSEAYEWHDAEDRVSNEDPPWGSDAYHKKTGLLEDAIDAARTCFIEKKPLPNVWIGVSVEDQARADERIPALLDTPAAVRFISAEPLLGPVDLSLWLKVFNRSEMGLADDPLASFMLQDAVFQGNAFARSALHWIIVGGESGPGARPMHPEWARSLRDQCAAAGVPFFFKQWGEHVFLSECAEAMGMPEDEADNEWLRQFSHKGADDGKDVIYRVGKSRAGRHLDGVIHDAMPKDHI